LYVLEKLIESDHRNALGIEWIKLAYNTTCPASVEYKHDLIGKRRMDNFCKHGCSVICMNEYLELRI